MEALAESKEMPTEKKARAGGLSRACSDNIKKCIEKNAFVVYMFVC